MKTDEQSDFVNEPVKTTSKASSQFRISTLFWLMTMTALSLAIFHSVGWAAADLLPVIIMITVCYLTAQSKPAFYLAQGICSLVISIFLVLDTHSIQHFHKAITQSVLTSIAIVLAISAFRNGEKWTRRLALPILLFHGILLVFLCLDTLRNSQRFFWYWFPHYQV